MVEESSTEEYRLERRDVKKVRNNFKEICSKVVATLEDIKSISLNLSEYQIIRVDESRFLSSSDETNFPQHLCDIVCSRDLSYFDKFLRHIHDRSKAGSSSLLLQLRSAIKEEVNTKKEGPDTQRNEKVISTVRRAWRSSFPCRIPYIILGIGIMAFIIILAILLPNLINGVDSNSNSTEISTIINSGTTDSPLRAFPELANRKVDDQSLIPINLLLPITPEPRAFPTTEKSSTSPKIPTQPSTIRSFPLPKVPNQRKIQSIRIESKSTYDFHIPAICNDSVRTRLLMANPSSYEFKGFNYSCASRIDGILFNDSYLYIDETSNFLNQTTYLTSLVFNGSRICIRNEGEGSRISFLNSISLYYLKKLEFRHLGEGNSTADCTELYSWFASEKVVNYALKRLSMLYSKFTHKNILDIDQLFKRAFSSYRFRELNVIGAMIEATMFNVEMPRRNLTRVGFHARNYLSKEAQDSLYNLITLTLFHANVTIFDTNIPIPFEKFRDLVKRKLFDKMGVKRLRITVYIEDYCEKVNLEFLHDIPNVLSIELKLVFSRKCVVEAKKSPVMIERVGVSRNTDDFKIMSNAKFIVLGLSDLYCKNVKRTNSSVTITRRVIC